jgi:putative transcriptional regulator
MAQGKGPKKALVALGYAGWGPGQLEAEIADNAWLTIPADSRIIFDTPIEQRWSAAAKQLGIDLNLISSTAGHA